MKTHQLYTKPVSNDYRLAYYSSIILVAITFITWTIAMLTPPLAGPFCPGNCFQYPYHEAITRFPRDYYWMYPAIVLNIIYLVYMVIIHHLNSQNKRIYSLSGLLFSASGAILLVLNYFVQVSVIQPSLLNNEFDGIALLTQFNPHGLFIVIEEAGFSFMAIGFLFTGLCFSKNDRLQQIIRIIYIGSFLLAIVSFFVISLFYGIFREYYFECAIISIVWLTMIVNGILLSRYFSMKYHKTLKIM
ncbi:MAG: hypothetical protein JW798_10650 [Prolixibacteraceae bacterium]|nr:hypothetical protein [Prolixibacteraceae bacterium]